MVWPADAVPTDSVPAGERVMPCGNDGPCGETANVPPRATSAGSVADRSIATPLPAARAGSDTFQLDGAGGGAGVGVGDGAGVGETGASTLFALEPPPQPANSVAQPNKLNFNASRRLISFIDASLRNKALVQRAGQCSIDDRRFDDSSRRSINCFFALARSWAIDATAAEGRLPCLAFLPDRFAQSHRQEGADVDRATAAASRAHRCQLMGEACRVGCSQRGPPKNRAFYMGVMMIDAGAKRDSGDSLPCQAAPACHRQSMGAAPFISSVQPDTERRRVRCLGRFAPRVVPTGNALSGRRSRHGSARLRVALDLL